MSSTNTVSGSLHEVTDATTPHASTPHEVSDAQRQLSAMQWGVPALTGALVVISAFAGEQRRPRVFLSGIARQIAV